MAKNIKFPFASLNLYEVQNEALLALISKVSELNY